ncbi:hypothetical protein AB0G92_17635, partial [Streptomyces californicus]
ETSPDGRRKLRRPDKGQVFALVALAVSAVAYFVNVDMGGETSRTRPCGCGAVAPPVPSPAPRDVPDA